MTALLLLVAASNTTAETSARNEKVAALAKFLKTVETSEVASAVGLLSGEPKQGRVGIGWATVGAAIETLAPLSSVTNDHPIEISDVDRTIELVAETHGDGSAGTRRDILQQLLERATEDEESFLRAILTGGLRQGAAAGVVASAAAKAYGVKLAEIRRAAMLLGDLGEAAEIAAAGGSEALNQVSLVVGRAIQPMLASTATSVSDALGHTGLASVEWKLDGIRIQVHKAGTEVKVFTRNLNEITGRTDRVVQVAGALDADSAVLDGEVLGGEPHFFDILHVDGTDLLSCPLTERHAVLERVAPAHRIPVIITDDPDAAATHLSEAMAAGHEGVMVKGVQTTYDAGRRGKGWRKVKPVHTLDLVVLGAEWGHGRRTGWLSNLHLGALDQTAGEFMMVGKTFKGMTDAMLKTQTERFLALETHREGITVFIRPEVVVEIALDASHESTRYPGGVALRFARVKQYRDDKKPYEADTLEAVKALMTALPAGESW
jgi:DNA ligase-1